jgi:transcriptional regulator with XRE-family HTH domain
MKSSKKGKDTSEEVLKKIGKRLKALRKAKGFTNYEHIAYELGMSRSQYWSYEAGKNIEIKTLLRILSLLDISIVDFFAGLEGEEN